LPISLQEISEVETSDKENYTATTLFPFRRIVSSFKRTSLPPELDNDAKKLIALLFSDILEDEINIVIVAA